MFMIKEEVPILTPHKQKLVVFCYSCVFSIATEELAVKSS